MMVTAEELEKFASLVARADMIVLHFGPKKAAVGPDLQAALVRALRRPVLAEDDDHGYR